MSDTLLTREEIEKITKRFGEGTAVKQVCDTALALMAEVERLRPVVEAARLWFVDDSDQALWDAVKALEEAEGK